MRTVYRVLAYLVALEVVIQAAAIAFAIFGLLHWIDEGGVLDGAAQSGPMTFTGVVGFIVHGLNGRLIVPLIALLLLIASFFAKIPGGVLRAGRVFLAVVVQVFLGIFGHGIPELGISHGVVALVIFAFAVSAARRAGTGFRRTTVPVVRGAAGMA